jgi:hypothetical protein
MDAASVFAHAGQYNKAMSELKPPWLRNPSPRLYAFGDLFIGSGYAG